MNLTQNDRLNQVTADTLIVGVDIGVTIHGGVLLNQAQSERFYLHTNRTRLT